MKRHLTAALVVLALTGSATADEPTKPHTHIQITTNSEINDRRDKAGLVHYFCWQRLHKLGFWVDSKTKSWGDKWMKKEVDKVSPLVDKEHPNDLVLETTLKTKYTPSEFYGKIVAHVWTVKAQVVLKSPDGKVLKEFKFTYKDGGNTKNSRKKLRQSFLQKVSWWVLLDLFRDKAIADRVPEAKKEDLAKEIKLLEDKREKYKDNFGDGEDGKDAKKSDEGK